MSRRIRRILLVCNNYDTFSLEEDGRIEPKISSEYLDLNLSNPPSIVRAESTLDALEMAEKGERFDRVITMYNVGALNVFDFSRKMKEIQRRFTGRYRRLTPPPLTTFSAGTIPRTLSLQS